MPPKRFARPRGRGVLLVTQTDERLVELVCAGEVRAFEEIVRRYRRRLRAYCRRLVPEPAVDDAVQQAFVNAYAAMRRNGVPIRLRPWLFCIARNAAFDALREMSSSAEQLCTSHDGVEGPDQAAERREHLRHVLAGVASLPERQRTAIILREFDGRSYDEIAAQLGVSDGAVRQLLNRARTKLRASAAALTPLGLLLRWRLTGAGPRVAELCAQVGGGAAACKFCVALLASGAMVAGDAHLPRRSGEGEGRSQAAISSDGAHGRDTTGASGGTRVEETGGLGGQGGARTGLPHRGQPRPVRAARQDRDRAAREGGESREWEDDESVVTRGGRDRGGAHGGFGVAPGEVEEDGDVRPGDGDGRGDDDGPAEGDGDDGPGDNDERPDDDGDGDDGDDGGEDGDDGDEGLGDDDREDGEPGGDEDRTEAPVAVAADGDEPAGDDGGDGPGDDADDGPGNDVSDLPADE